MLAVLLFLFLPATAQQTTWPDPETAQLFQTSENALMNGAYRQAAVGFQQLLVRVPDNYLVKRDLAQALLRSGDAEGAEKILGALIEDPRVDAYTYVLAAQTQMDLGSDKLTLKRLNRGIEKFPQFGLLYYERGKFYDRKQYPADALKEWVTGIHVEPDFFLNYYEAAKAYFKTNEFFWGMIYAEIFINLESETDRSQEMRKALLNAYKRFYFTTDAQKMLDGKNDFKNQVGKILMKLTPVVGSGVNPESMTMLRTRLSMEWEAIPMKQYSSSLFEWYDRLIREGHFDAYNQWLFGPADQVASFEAWRKFHPEAIPAFEAYRKKGALKPLSSDAQPQSVSKNLFKNLDDPKR
jgi:tetratricopeptide (TPR) repeat protein